MTGPGAGAGVERVSHMRCAVRNWVNKGSENRNCHTAKSKLINYNSFHPKIFANFWAQKKEENLIFFAANA